MKRNVLIVPFVTFFCGFFPFLILSILNGHFWKNDFVDIPMFSSVAVMIGDSIFLPLINYMLFNLLINTLDRNLALRYGRIISICFLFFLLFSIFINTASHENWSNDMLGDFVSFRQGGLTTAGYIHYIFSILEMAVLLCFPVFWFLSIKSRNNEGIAYSKKIWKMIFIFTCFVIIDMFIKHCFFYHNKSIIESMKIERYPFFPCLLSIILFVIMSYIERKNLISRKQIIHKFRRAA